MPEKVIKLALNLIENVIIILMERNSPNNVIITG